MKNKYLKSFFEGIEEGLHWTPVGLLTVPLWGFRKNRGDWWSIGTAISVGVSSALLFIKIIGLWYTNRN